MAHVVNFTLPVPSREKIGLAFVGCPLPGTVFFPTARAVGAILFCSSLFMC